MKTKEQIKRELEQMSDPYYWESWEEGYAAALEWMLRD